MSDGGSRFTTEVRDSWGTQIGEKNVQIFNQIEHIENILHKRYKGENARLRTAIQHDLQLYRDMEPGKVRDALGKSIDKRVATLAEKNRRTVIESWTKWSMAGVVLVVVTTLTITVGRPIASRHAAIENGHPEYSLDIQWKLAASSFMNGEEISPRGNLVLPVKRVTGAGGQRMLPNIEQSSAFFIISLTEITPVATCQPGAAAPLPESKYGQFILLEFEISAADQDISNAGFFARRDFFSVANGSGVVRDIGEGPGKDCIAGTTSVLNSIAKNQTFRIKIVADVPAGRGTIGYRTPGGWAWEWRY